jgi:hypothetical protein
MVCDTNVRSGACVGVIKITNQKTTVCVNQQGEEPVKRGSWRMMIATNLGAEEGVRGPVGQDQDPEHAAAM